ncbi:unnamed protein product [Cylicocyclus nassatus]|uniref:Uncharacterized protein n=1 Tax=Cylicocyclus nassatus TaxID=53992 RepID=A0AA36DT04_CYLNA|nr:unnamed protein product [Cylicocyclus nassatus]
MFESAPVYEDALWEYSYMGVQKFKSKVNRCVLAPHKAGKNVTCHHLEKNGLSGSLVRNTFCSSAVSMCGSIYRNWLWDNRVPCNLANVNVF